MDGKNRISFANELGVYKQALRQYWPLSLSIGLLFLWLYLLPMQGSLLWDLTRNREVSQYALISPFLLGHTGGLILAAIIASCRPKITSWLSWGLFHARLVPFYCWVYPDRSGGCFFFSRGYSLGLLLLAGGLFLSPPSLSHIEEECWFQETLCRF